MTSRMRRSATAPSRDSLAESDPVRHAWTIMISVQESGTLSCTVGRRDLTSKRMTFVRLDDVELPRVSGPGLLMALCRVVTIVGEDPETRVM